jgi:hypothetical protein
MLIEVAETHPPANGKKLATAETRPSQRHGSRCASFARRQMAVRARGAFCGCALGLGGLHRAWPAHRHRHLRQLWRDVPA